ncbi:hypothetical protein IPM62_03525 [Candidatus Woesebacteria bacterium]|nr:MAG: hypothetical protein IPM62_03525 [Candidatus Woesebacteria bacterium]
MDVLSFSRETKKTAERILEETGIVEKLSSHGKVSIGGSYALDLMYGPDIDITVECKNPREASVECLNSFVKNSKFQKYEYGDFVKHPRVNRPAGYIVNLRNVFEDKMWEVEIWFLDSVEKVDREYINEIKKKLTPDACESILLIKHQREEKQISKHELSSVKIYDAVINNGAKSIEDIHL